MVGTRGRPRMGEPGESSRGERRESTPPTVAGDPPPATTETTVPPVQTTTDMPPPQTGNPHPARSGAEGSSPDMFQMFSTMLAAMEQQRGRQVVEVRDTPVQPASTLSVLEKFMKLSPPVYSGEPDVEQAEEWVEEMTKIFETMDCSPRQRVIFATFRLKGAAERWWRMVKDKWERAGTEWTWMGFEVEYRRHFIPGVVKDQREAAFLALEQGGMSIAQYESRYSALARFNPHLVPDEAARAKRFVGGLRHEFRTKLIAFRFQEYHEAVERAYEIEEDIERHRGRRDVVQTSALAPAPAG